MSRTGAETDSLAERYFAGLEGYVTAPEEAGRAKAYEVGRHALEIDLGVLELTAAHRSALQRLLSGASEAEAVRLNQLAWEFFVEAVAPFEMSLRGFRSANLRLLSANEALERRTHELERARAETESERATLAAVIASIGDGLLVLDSTDTVRIANERAGDLLGTADDLIGSHVDRLRELLAAAAEERPATTKFLDRALTRRDTRVTAELQLAGPRRDLALEAFLLQSPDREGLGIVLRDLTAQRELDRAKDELVAVVSHELRSPLAAVCGFVELLLARDLEPERRTRHLETVLQEARRLGSLIDDFLDLQRLDRGATRIEPVPTDLRALLERARTTSADRGQPIVLDVAATLPAVTADPERIWQVLLNLLTNASKYSPAGGEIRLAARPLEAQIEVSVQDQGLGIPHDALPHLFEDFYRVPAPDRAGIPGTGLGLSISRKIVEAHGGRIWAESKGTGCGTTFFFTLPLAEL